MKGYKITIFQEDVPEGMPNNNPISIDIECPETGNKTTYYKSNIRDLDLDSKFKEFMLSDMI